MPEKSPLHQLSELGQSVWIDYLSRDLLRSGELARMMEDDCVVGVTSNPTIFQKAISQGTAYDEQLKDLLEHESDPSGMRAKGSTATSLGRSTRRSPSTARRPTKRRSGCMHGSTSRTST
jgi:transaldolase